MQIYSIRDSKADAYLQPFFASNEAVAKRYVASAVNTPKHEFDVHTEDYSLYHIGTFSEETGTIHAVDPRCVTLLVHLVTYEPAPRETGLGLVPGDLANGESEPSPIGQNG